MALSLFNTTVQLSTPRWVVGRALSLYQMATFGGMALGSWCWGNVAEHFGVATALLGAAAAMLLAAAIGLRLPLPAKRSLDLDPLNRWREPQIGLEIQPRSGPISHRGRISDRRGRDPRAFSMPWRSASASGGATARITGR